MFEFNIYRICCYLHKFPIFIGDNDIEFSLMARERHDNNIG